MRKTSDTEFYSLSLSSIAPPPYSPRPQLDEVARNNLINLSDSYEKKSQKEPKPLIKRLKTNFISATSTTFSRESHSFRSYFRRAHRYLTRLVVNWWLLELISWGISALSIAAISFLLGYYDGRAVPDQWPLGITLNTYISVLSGISKYALALPIDEAIGQLKWHWFARRPRPLLDFERFDDATRGPYGAFALFLHTKGRSLASLGAIITVLSLAADPFFQQLISLPKRPSAYGHSTVPIMVDFKLMDASFQNGTDSTEFGGPDRLLQDVALSFMFDNGTERPLSAFCPTEECTWRPFDTLAVCSACANVSSMLTFACIEETGEWRSNDTTITIDQTNVTKTTSCGYFLNATTANPILMSGYALDESSVDGIGEILLMRNLNLHDVNIDTTYWGGSINFATHGFPIVDYIQVTGENAESVLRNQTPVARECAVHWCTKHIIGSYKNGNYSEEVLSESYDSSVPFDPLYWGSNMDFYYFKNITIQPEDSSTTFKVPNYTALTTIFLFQEYMPAYLTAENTTSTPFLRINNWVGEQPEFHKYNFNPFAPPNDGAEYLKRLTDTMTNVIRTYPESSETFAGSGSVETYIHVRWGFIAFPMVLINLTLVFLVAVIMEHRRHKEVGIWKTSIIAAMTSGLDERARDSFKSTKDLYDVFERSVRVKVGLYSDRSSRRYLQVVRETENG
ncbi:uncharacterized protein PV09_03062 [Verruconis gallopava]|uniref:Uncharacterized protein n=1 Tax=Verruconis gallopava TaxID=253628 RepID=A0A0D2B3M0_9PEZI|nr:uncharacterized protein PV09_03062 [Verruconis gallopava]KIW05859.1 hypothetical protein PV09_03062 [Verruconis gallopava]